MSGVPNASPIAAPPVIPPAAPSQPTDPTISDTTYQKIAVIFAWALAVCTCAIVGVLCYRVALDGNNATTATITAQLADNVKWLVLGLAAVILGKNAISALIAKFTGGAV